MSRCGCTSFCQLRFTWREFRKRTFILSAWAYLSFQGFWIFHYYSGLLTPPVWLQGPSVCWGNWKRRQALGAEGKAKLFMPQIGRSQRGPLKCQPCSSKCQWRHVGQAEPFQTRLCKKGPFPALVDREDILQLTLSQHHQHHCHHHHQHHQ